MSIEIVIPRLGWDMEHGGFGGWLKSDGDPVAMGDLLFTLESEKATEDIESLDAGTLHIAPDGPKAGDKVAVGTVIGYLLAPGESMPHLETPSALPIKQGSAKEDSTPGELEAAPSPAETRANRAISPRARRIAVELGVDVTQLQGTGRTGRVRERDVRAASRPLPGSQAVGAAASRPVPMTALRRTISERMLRSTRSTVPVTLTTTVDAANLVNLRNQLKAGATSPDMVVPSYTDFIVKLVAIALGDHPLLVARREGDQIVAGTRIDIGIAIDTEAGLLVPVVRDVPHLGLRDLAVQTRDLAARARRRALKAEEMQGGVFTVTSLGAYGIDAFTPVINYPEVAILGIGRIQQRPFIVDDRIVAREAVTLSLTFDHCLVDGAPAARFLQHVGTLVENPGAWLIH